MTKREEIPNNYIADIKTLISEQQKVCSDIFKIIDFDIIKPPVANFKVERQKQEIQAETDAKRLISEINAIRNGIYQKNKPLNTLENQYQSLLEKHSELTAKNNQLKASNEEYSEIYNKAIEKYSALLDMKIKTKKKKDDNFACNVFLFETQKHPLKFKINRNTRKIIDWTAPKLLSKSIQNKLKENFKQEKFVDYFPLLLFKIKEILLSEETKK